MVNEHFEIIFNAANATQIVFQQSAMRHRSTTLFTLYGFPNTRSSRICWMLEELEQAYNLQVVDLKKGGQRQPEFLAVNPGGKVPALRDGELLLTESAAIITYLGDKLGRRDLVPQPGTATRAKYEQWLHFAQSELDSSLATVGKHKFALPAEYRVPAVIPTAEWEFQKALNVLSQGLGEQPYILGEQFSAADILLGQILLWATSAKQPVTQPNLCAYLERLRSRPAFARFQAREQAAS